MAGTKPRSAEWKLQLIHDICVGYDGYRSAKDLMSLIDELRCIAKGAEGGHEPDCKQEFKKINKATCKCAKIYRKVMSCGITG